MPLEPFFNFSAFSGKKTLATTVDARHVEKYRYPTGLHRAVMIQTQMKMAESVRMRCRRMSVLCGG